MPFTKINNITIHYEWLHQNRSKNIVFINALGSSLIIWTEVVSRIKHKFNILTFDKRGHGYSSTDDSKPGIDDYADDVIELMDFVNMGKAHIVGLSIGGAITYSLATRYPDRFEKLIFSNTGGKLGTKESWNERIESVSTRGLSAMSQGTIERWLSAEFRKRNPADIEGYQNMVKACTERGYMQACAALGEADYNPVLHKIRHPSMFIGGGGDIGTTPDFVKENAKNLGAERVEIIDCVGHLPCVEAPEIVAGLILEFLTN